MPFEGFDFTNFWEESTYRDNYACGPLLPAALAEAEKMLGYKLPASYVWLMERKNGGVPVNRAFPTKTPVSWAGDHIAIESIFGVGLNTPGCIVGETRLMVEEWGYPEIGVAICDCPSAGHDEVFLDYRACGPQGEPKVVHIDQEDDYLITPLADTFEEFIRGLVSEDEFDFDEDGEDE